MLNIHQGVSVNGRKFSRDCVGFSLLCIVIGLGATLQPIRCKTKLNRRFVTHDNLVFRAFSDLRHVDGIFEVKSKGEVLG